MLTRRTILKALVGLPVVASFMGRKPPTPPVTTATTATAAPGDEPPDGRGLNVSSTSGSAWVRMLPDGEWHRTPFHFTNVQPGDTFGYRVVNGPVSSTVRWSWTEG